MGKVSDRWYGGSDKEKSVYQGKMQPIDDDVMKQLDATYNDEHTHATLPTGREYVWEDRFGYWAPWKEGTKK